MTDAFGGAGFVAVEVARGFLAGGEIKDARLAARDVAASDCGLEVLVEASFLSAAVEGLAIDLTAVEVVGFAAGAAFVVSAGFALMAPNVPELRI